MTMNGNVKISRLLGIGLMIAVLISATLYYVSRKGKSPLTPPAQDTHSGQAALENSSRSLASSEKAPSAKALTQEPAKAPLAAQPVAKQVAQEQGCFQISYRHKPLASHADGEACLHHKNLFQLAHAGISSKSVCVRVNGTPVKFQVVGKKKDSVLIGPVAGPQALVTIRYCLGKFNCAENCKIPKDEFMAAISGTDGDDDDLAPKHAGRKPAGWTQGNTGTEQALEGELSKLDQETRGGASGNIFKGWMNQTPNGAQTACQGKWTKRSGR